VLPTQAKRSLLIEFTDFKIEVHEVCAIHPKNLPTAVSAGDAGTDTSDDQWDVTSNYSGAFYFSFISSPGFTLN